MFYSVTMFRTSNPEDSASSDLQGTAPKWDEAGARLSRGLQQRAGSPQKIIVN